MNTSWYGRPIEEVDPLIFEDTFCVISKKFGKNIIYRFNSTKSCWLFSPLNPLRKFAILIVTHNIFDLLIVFTILANCVTLAMITNIFDPQTSEKIEPAYDYYTDRIEYGFLAVFTVELILKVVAKGFICHKFSYMRNRWNLLDLIVVVSGYVTIAKDLSDPSTSEDNELDFLRTFRVLRVVKTISILPGLKMMINALLSSVVQLLEVMALTFVCLIIFSLFAQELYMGRLKQKCVIDKAGPEDPDAIIHIPIAQEPAADIDRVWTEWVSHHENWARRDFPNDEPTQCGNGSTMRKCPSGHTCIGMLGENPDDGWTNFDTMFNSMLSTFQLLTLDYWERLYDVVLSTCGVGSLIFFILVIFLGAYYLLNLMLAVVAMSYENEVESNQAEAMPIAEKLGMNRRHSTFSLDELSQLEIIKMTQTTKRTVSEKARLAVKLRMRSFAEEDTDHEEAGEHRPHLDDAIMNIIGMRRTVVDGRHHSLEREWDDYQKDKILSEAKVATEEGDSEAELDETGVKKRPNACKRLKLMTFSCMSKYLKPIVDHQLFEGFITLCIVCNTVCLAMEHHGMSEDMEFVLSIMNKVFMAVFTLEMVLKVMALQREYFETGWNIFDMVIVVVSFIDLAISDSGGSRGLSVIRSMRLLRVFKLAQSWVTMRILMNIIFSSFGALGNLTAVLLIVIYIFAVMGMQMVGDQYTPHAFEAQQNAAKFPKWHWRHFGYAFMLVFRCLCGEWIEPLWECLKAQEYYVEHNPGKNALMAYFKCFAIFMPITVVGNFIVLNLFLAMLLNSFDTEELNAQRDRELDAHKRAENLKNIVGMLTTKKEGQDDEEEEGAEEGSAVMPQPRASFEDKSPKGKEQLAPPVNVSNKQNSSHHFEAPARKRFKSIVNKIILQNRISKAELAIARAENYRKRHRHKILLGMLLTNPGMKSSGFEYDLTPEASEASETLRTPGECIPGKVLSSKYCFCRYGARRPSHQGTGSWWFHLRSWCVTIVSHTAFEYSILLLIFCSSITLAFEDIHLDSKPTLKMSLCFLNIIFTGIFGVEMILKIGAIGAWGYFTSFWTILDAFIVTVSMVSVYFDITLKICSGAAVRSGRIANLGALKALRTLRALRPLRAISRWQGMKIVVNALLYAIPSIFNVLLVCLLFWLIFSIMGVQFFKGQFYRCVNSEGDKMDSLAVPDKAVCCAKADTHGYSWVNTVSNYDNVFEGYLSLFQIATFEGWMELMEYSVDAAGLDKQPTTDNQIGYYFFYVIFIILGSFFTLQLFIGVIIDNFNMLKKKYEGNLLEVMLTPMQRNYYIAMKHLGKKKPMPVIRRPKFGYRAFFYDLAMSRKLEVVIFIMIFLNILVEACKKSNQSQPVTHILAGLNVIFTIIYALEALIKIVGLGTFYFTIPWNVYDFTLVMTSVSDVFLGDLSVVLPIPPTMLRTVRVVRIGRILRLVKSAQGIRKLMYALVVSLPALFNIGALLALITFIYAILGMALFGKAPRKWSIDDMFNFETFKNSNLMLIRLMTAAGWNEVLDSLTVVDPVCGQYRHIECGLSPAEPECPNRALVVAYIISYLFMAYLIVINLYIAIILENYVEASNEEDVGIVEDDFDMFYNCWARVDPFASQFINFDELSDFLHNLDQPLKVQKPNIVAIVAFNLPIARGNKLHCLDILQALIKQVLGPVDDSKEFRKLQIQMEHKFQKQFPTRRILDIVSTTRQWRIENNAAAKIQRYWRSYRKKKAEEEQELQRVDSKSTVNTVKTKGTNKSHYKSKQASKHTGVNPSTKSKADTAAAGLSTGPGEGSKAPGIP